MSSWQVCGLTGDGSDAVTHDHIRDRRLDRSRRPADVSRLMTFMALDDILAGSRMTHRLDDRIVKSGDRSRAGHLEERRAGPLGPSGPGPPEAEP